MGALAAGEVPFVLTPHYHGGGHTAFAHVLHYGYRPLGTWLIKRAAAVICVSKAEALALEEREHTVRSRTLVIPNAPASTGLLSEASTRGAQLVLSLGRLVPYKNNRLLLDGFRLLDSDAELVIAGDGVERPALAAAARNDPRVRIVGQVDRPTLDRLLSSAWVVASLSGHEAFGMALLEGLLAGARVVVSDIPAHREVIELCSAEDRGALLPLPASPATVAAALGAALLAGPPSTSISGWTWDDIAQRTLRVYDTVLAAGSRRIVLTSLQV
jgi:glycosyltransferase involved in cell wall biosynthesis